MNDNTSTLKKKLKIQTGKRKKKLDLHAAN